MAWIPCRTNHDWQPINGWQGRYKCSDCFTLGYHKLVIATERNFPTGLHGKHDRQILPYLCPKCHGPTTKRDAQCLMCRPDKPNWKWQKIPSGWCLVQDRLRVARVEWLAKKWVTTIRGVEVSKTTIPIAEAKRAVELAFGLVEDVVLFVDGNQGVEITMLVDDPPNRV